MPRTLLGSDRAIFATGLALVLRVNLVEVCDVLGCRIVARVRARDGLERLPSSPPALSWLLHTCDLPDIAAGETEVVGPEIGVTFPADWISRSYLDTLGGSFGPGRGGGTE